MVLARCLSLVCLSVLATALFWTPANAGQTMVRSAQSWSYQLTGNMSAIAASNADVVVVDADHGGSAARFKTKPGGGRRAAIAYLSVGEAETWRGYWKSCCASSRPQRLVAHRNTFLARIPWGGTYSRGCCTRCVHRLVLRRLARWSVCASVVRLAWCPVMLAAGWTN